MNWTVAQIASVVLCAMGSGLALSSLGYSPILGYIIAGVLLGPSCLQFIVDREVVGVFSEMGILFLLFAIGLGLSFEKVKNIWKTSLAFTVLSTALIYVVMLITGEFWPNIPSSVVVLITFCVTLSSTAVTVKSLKYLRERDDNIEENTFGILVSQDLVALLMVIMINFLGSRGDYSTTNISLVLVASALIVFYFLRYRTKHIHKLAGFIKKHEDMLTMSIFGICLGSAVLAELIGLSAPFGGFIAGLMLGNSNMKNEIKNIAAPIEELLLMTFFLSVGLLVDIRFIIDHFLIIFSALIFVTFGKTIINIFVLRSCKFSLKESFVISVLLANVGEFSFMLVSAAGKGGLVNTAGVKFLVSLTTLSLFLSPFWLIFAERCRAIAESVSAASSFDFLQLAFDREIKKMHHFSSFISKLCNRTSSALHRKGKNLLEKRKDDQ